MKYQDHPRYKGYPGDDKVIRVIGPFRPLSGTRDKRLPWIGAFSDAEGWWVCGPGGELFVNDSGLLVYSGVCDHTWPDTSITGMSHCEECKVTLDQNCVVIARKECDIPGNPKRKPVPQIGERYDLGISITEYRNREKEATP